MTILVPRKIRDTYRKSQREEIAVHSSDIGIVRGDETFCQIPRYEILTFRVQKIVI